MLTLNRLSFRILISSSSDASFPPKNPARLLRWAAWYQVRSMPRTDDHWANIDESSLIRQLFCVRPCGKNKHMIRPLRMQDAAAIVGGH